MKRILAIATALLLAACAAAPAIAGPFGIVFTQRNSADTGNILRTPATPTIDSIMFLNRSTNLPDYVSIGPGLVFSGGVLQSAVPLGPKGDPGDPGRDGANGIDGTNGANGFDGKSAYELATVDGFSGTLQAWLASLKGAPGADGQSIVGPQGPAGTPAPTFNFGLPASRTLVLTTPYQAANPAKPAIVTVSPVCSASLTLSGGSTCSLQARIGLAPLTCTSGTVVANWTNGNTGALTVGLALNQIMGAPYGINLPTGASFILCPNAGTFTVTASEQSAG